MSEKYEPTNVKKKNNGAILLLKGYFKYLSLKSNVSANLGIKIGRFLFYRFYIIGSNYIVMTSIH